MPGALPGMIQFMPEVYSVKEKGGKHSLVYPASETTKVCKIIALWAMFKDFGPSSYLLLGLRFLLTLSYKG